MTCQSFADTRRFPDLMLRETSLDDGIDIWLMLREIGPGENGFGNEGASVPFSHFATYLQRRRDMQAGVNLPDGLVAMTTYWLFRGDAPVGMSKLRHKLTDSLRRIGGHVGYCVRPSERGNGYGNAVLALTLLAAKTLGLKELLITCRADNTASRRVAERNGGEFDGTADGIAYYWIAVDEKLREERECR